MSGTQVRSPRVVSTQERGEPRRSGRVVRQLERFSGLGEIPVDPEIDPCNYNKAIQDKDATLWQRAMNTKMSLCTPIRFGFL